MPCGRPPRLPGRPDRPGPPAGPRPPARLPPVQPRRPRPQRCGLREWCSAAWRGRTSPGTPVRRLASDTTPSTGVPPISPVTPRRATPIHPPVSTRQALAPWPSRPGQPPGTGVTHCHPRRGLPATRTADSGHAKTLKSMALGATAPTLAGKSATTGRRGLPLCSLLFWEGRPGQM